MIKVTVTGKDVPLDHSRTLAQSGIRAGATLKLKSTGLLGGMQGSCAGGIAPMFGGTEAAENRTLRERVRALEQQLLIH